MQLFQRSTCLVMGLALLGTLAACQNAPLLGGAPPAAVVAAATGAPAAAATSTPAPAQTPRATPTPAATTTRVLASLSGVTDWSKAVLTLMYLGDTKPLLTTSLQIDGHDDLTAPAGLQRDRLVLVTVTFGQAKLRTLVDSNRLFPGNAQILVDYSSSAGYASLAPRFQSSATLAGKLAAVASVKLTTDVLQLFDTFVASLGPVSAPATLQTQLASAPDDLPITLGNALVADNKLLGSGFVAAGTGLNALLAAAIAQGAAAPDATLLSRLYLGDLSVAAVLTTGGGGGSGGGGGAPAPTTTGTVTVTGGGLADPTGLPGIALI